MTSPDDRTRTGSQSDAADGAEAPRVERTGNPSTAGPDGPAEAAAASATGAGAPARSGRSERDGGVATAPLAEVARARFRASTEAPTAFFEANAERIALACLDLARTFHQGGRLLVFGRGAQRSDALHVSVEFVHPVIVGKRALPAIALQHDDTARQLRTIGRADDAALGIACGGDRDAVSATLDAARGLGLRTFVLVGADTDVWPADHVFSVPAEDPLVVQEVHETTYHVLWELVHVFLEHPGMLT